MRTARSLHDAAAGAAAHLGPPTRRDVRARSWIFISAATAPHSPHRHRARVSRRGTTLSGYLLFSRSATAGLITKLAVSVAFRRCGIGSALLRRGIQELERPARRLAPSEIQLHVDPANTSARSLYESFGFERVALLPQYYSDSRDALLMRRLTASHNGSSAAVLS